MMPIELIIHEGAEVTLQTYDPKKGVPGDPLPQTQPEKRKRIRLPSVTTIATQLWKAARATGVNVAVTVEGGKVTATPVVGEAGAGEANEWDTEFGTHTPQTRQ